MPYKRRGIYYIKRSLPGIEGKVYRTLDTRSKTRARKLEDVLLTLCRRGHPDPVRAWLRGDVTIHELGDAFDGGTIPVLMQRLRTASVPLADGFRRALAAKAPDVKPSTLQRYRESAAHVERIAGDATVQAVMEPEFVQRYKAKRLEEGAARSTVNKGLQAISLLATYALEKGWIQERPEISRYAAPERIRWLEPDDVAAYMAALRRRFRSQFELLIGTGMRLGETEAIRRRDVQFGRSECRIMLRDAKSRAGIRPVFVPEWAAASLRRHMESGADLVFTIPRRTVQKEHDRACALVGIAGYTIHDHRHTFAVHAARAGMPLHLLQRQLGHASIQQTMKYAAFHPEYADVGRYFERVGEHLGLSDSTGRGAIRGAVPATGRKGVDV